MAPLRELLSTILLLANERSLTSVDAEVLHKLLDVVDRDAAPEAYLARVIALEELVNLARHP